MKRTLLFIAVLASATQGTAQQKPSAGLPVIAPKVTDLGTIMAPDNDTPWDPAMSPRGTLMAYNTNAGLHVWNPATRSSTLLAKGYTEGTTWSPAGDAIAFAREDDQGSKEFIWSVRVDPATGKAVGSLQRLSVSATTGYTPQYSPDGKFLAFSRADAAQRASLVVVPAAGGSERALASGFGVRKIRWSGDGAMIYYVSYPDSAWSKTLLSRVAASGGSSQLVREYQDVADAPRLTGDARFVAIPERRTAERNSLTLTDLTGKPVARLTYAPDAWIGEWAGAYRLSGERDTHPRGLSITDLSNATTRVLIDTTAEVGPPAWFPDGRRVAVIAKYDGVPALVTIGTDGGGLRKLPLIAVPHFTGVLQGWNSAELRVSPDGRYASYLGAGRKSLELVELSSGRQRTLTRSAITVTTPVWRRDSKSIRYTRDGAIVQRNNTRGIHEVTLDGVDKLVRLLPFSEFPGAAVVPLDENNVVAFGQGAVNHTLIPLDGGTPRVLAPTTGMGGGQLSPDRKTLALRLGPAAVQDFKPTRQLTFISLADTSKRTIDLPFTDVPLVGMQYQPDGRNILIAGREKPSDAISIYSVPVDGSAPRIVARADTKEPRTIFAASPDGRYIAYTVAATPRTTFFSLDYTDGISRLIPANAKR